MPPIRIPQFLLPGGAPSTRTLLTLSRQTNHTPRRCASTDTNNSPNPRVLEKPDKFRPPSHPARRLTPSSRRVINYPGPRLSEEEKREKAQKQYPHMFPPEGSVMYKFLTNRGIHVWIAFSVLTSLAVFTFTTNFKTTSPFAHLLPSWSGLLWSPFSTLSQAISVYRMDVEHKTVQAEEQRLQRFGDAYKRHQFRVAHGMKEGPAVGPETNVFEERDRENAKMGQEQEQEQGQGQNQEDYVDFEGQRRPVKKWLGIW